MSHSANMQLVTSLADQVREVKEHSSAFAELRNDYYMIVTSNNSVVYITISYTSRSGPTLTSSNPSAL